MKINFNKDMNVFTYNNKRRNEILIGNRANKMGKKAKRDLVTG
jgi:hypothetical protein